MITGASSGIGRELAREYAKRGANVVLVARRLGRLNDVAQELVQQYQVKAHVIVQDLSEIDAPKKILANTEKNNIHIDHLVNNAGYGFGEHFIGSHWAKVAHFHNVMTTSIIGLTHIYAPKMIERGYGRIVFISSMVTFMPVSVNMTLYNAAKTFINKFSESLRLELLGTGVHATVVCPGYTLTEFQKVAGYEDKAKKTVPTFMWMHPDKVAHIAINASEKNKVLVIVGIINKCMRYILKIVPRTLIRRLSKQVTQKHE